MSKRSRHWLAFRIASLVSWGHEFFKAVRRGDFTVGRFVHASRSGARSAWAVGFGPRPNDR